MPKEISIYARVALSLVLVAALLLAACGGGGGNDEDPQQVLTQTFSNPTPIKSGNFDLDFKIEANGGDSPATFEDNQAPTRRSSMPAATAATVLVWSRPGSAGAADAHDVRPVDSGPAHHRSRVGRVDHHAVADVDADVADR